MNFVKRYIWWVILAGALYGLLSFHFIIIGRTVKFLKKEKITLNDTFFSTKGKRVETILDNDALRDAGIGDILVDHGMITEERLEKLFQRQWTREGVVSSLRTGNLNTSRARRFVKNRHKSRHLQSRVHPSRQVEEKRDFSKKQAEKLHVPTR